MMKAVLQLITAFAGYLGFALLFNVRGRKLLPVGLGALLTWGTCLLSGLVIPSEACCYFLASVLLTIYAEVMARVEKSPATVFLTGGVIPLIPGSSLYTTMSCAIQSDWTGFSRQGLHTLILALAIALGILFTMSLLETGKQLVQQHRRGT